MSIAHTAQPSLAIPTRTRSTGKYPTAPLSIFPPPAPSVRRTIRDRRGVALTLQIDTPPNNPPGPWSPKGHIQPHRNHLPRRRNPKPCFQNFHCPEAPKQTMASAPTPTPKAETSAPPIPTPPLPEEPHLQAIIPAVWVAFSDSARTSSADRTHEDGFTHVVQIAHANGEAHAAGSTERRWDAARKAQRLRLVLPAAARGREREREMGKRAALALSDGQLRAARDFVAECLPSELAAMPEEGAVRVLVTAPPGRPTDAMSVLGCYLSFVAGVGVEEILRFVDEEEAVLSVWKGEVSGEEVERLEKIARGWSWLTTVGARK